jgi:hypothetical protein
MNQVNFENEFVDMNIKHGILHLKYKKEVLDIECAKNVVESRLLLSSGKTYPLFVDIAKVKTTTREARSYTSQGDAEKFISATALWGKSELTRLMANFFLSIYKPKVPVKFFTNHKKAVDWLHQFNHK